MAMVMTAAMQPGGEGEGGGGGILFYEEEYYTYSISLCFSYFLFGGVLIFSFFKTYIQARSMQHGGKRGEAEEGFLANFLLSSPGRPRGLKGELMRKTYAFLS